MLDLARCWLQNNVRLARILGNWTGGVKWHPDNQFSWQKCCSREYRTVKSVFKEAMVVAAAAAAALVQL